VPITHVQLFSVPVSDQDRAIDFYVNTLGFSVESDSDMDPDMRWVMLTLPGAQTAITLVTWFPSMPAGSLRGLVLETDDLEASVASMTERGAAPSEIQDAPWGRFVQLDDPDGNGIIVQASARDSSTLVH
jgi:catechol 2,3-dioxygenase-like lactoylglutathione lyase family enzyme